MKTVKEAYRDTLRDYDTFLNRGTFSLPSKQEVKDRLARNMGYPGFNAVGLLLALQIIYYAAMIIRILRRRN